MSNRAPLYLVLTLLVSLLPSFATAHIARVAIAPSMSAFEIAVPVKNLPVPEADVWLIRYIMGPGASLPEEYEVGNTLFVVDGGEATLTSNHAVHLKNITGNPASAATSEESSLLHVGAGEGALIPTGEVTSIRNDSSEVLHMMILKVFAPADKYRVHLPLGSLGHQPTGVVAQTISHGSASFTSSDGVLLIARDVGPAQDNAANDFQNGVEIGALQGGKADLAFVNSNGLFWPGILSHQNNAIAGGPVPLHSNAVIGMQTGDGYADPHGVPTWTSTSDDPLIILRGAAYSLKSLM